MDAQKKLYFRSHVRSRWINLFKNPNPNPQRILVHRADEIGDMVLTLPALRTLIQRFPNSEVVVWAKAPALSLLEGEPGIYQRISEGLQPDGHFDLMVDFRESEKSLAFAQKSRIRYRLNRGSIRMKNRNTGHPHEIETNFQVIAPFLNDSKSNSAPLVIPPRKQDQADLYLQRLAIEKFGIIHMGAGKLLKRWSLDGFRSLADLMHRKYGWDVVFVGAEGDRKHVEKIQSQLNFTTFSFIGEGDLLAYAGLCMRCEVMVGNDSGPMHIASNLEIPCVALFGPSEREVFGPISPKTVVIHHQLECNPCDEVHCITPEFPCIARITLAEIEAAMDDLIAKKA
jgi:heptosyltransferase II